MTAFRPCGWNLALLCLVSCTSCAGFPLAEYNPINREQWAHDEKFGPTIHTKLNELTELKASASRLSRPEQEEFSQLLLKIFREEPSTLVVVQATLALAEFPTESSLDGLRLAAEHTDPDVRIAACHGWRRKKSPEALETLARILGSDTDVDVRLAAADDLKTFREPQAVQALALALEDTNPALQYRAVESLKSITGRNLGNSAAAWRQLLQDGNLNLAPPESLADRVRSWF